MHWSGAGKRRGAAGVATAVLALAAATLGPTMLAGAAATGHQLTVDVTGNGYVTDATGAINCPPTCTASYPDPATSVELTAHGNASDTFQGWSGDCQGTTKCNVQMDADHQVGAAFTGAGPEPTPTPTPSPSATPTPSPSATPTPAPSPSPSPTASRPQFRLFVSLHRPQSLRRAHRPLRLRVRCSRACTATVKAKVSVPHHPAFALTPVTHILSAGTWKAFALYLPGPLRAAIRADTSNQHPAVAHVTISAKPASGSGLKTTRTVKLIP